MNDDKIRRGNFLHMINLENQQWYLKLKTSDHEVLGSTLSRHTNLINYQEVYNSFLF